MSVVPLFGRRVSFSLFASPCLNERDHPSASGRKLLDLIEGKMIACSRFEAQRLRTAHDVFRIGPLLGGCPQDLHQLPFIDVLAPVAHHGLQGARSARVFGDLAGSRQQTKLAHLRSSVRCSK